MKTGSSSMFRFMWEIEHPENKTPTLYGTEFGDEMYGHHFYHLVGQSEKFQSKSDLFRKIYESTEFKTFITVRHPLTRLFSSWNDRFSFRKDGTVKAEQYKLFKDPPFLSLKRLSTFSPKKSGFIAYFAFCAIKSIFDWTPL